MSYKAVFELFLQIHEFANIDLPSQGIFQLRASIYQQDKKQKTYAIPFEFMQPSKKATSNSKKIQAQSSIQPPYFFTKAGSIKYSDEKLIFEDQVRFKLQIQSFPRLHSENVIIQFELIFTEFTYSSSSVPQAKVVDNKKFKLENLELSVLNYCEGQFIGNYSSKFSFTLFACLSNFKFGKYKLPSELQSITRVDENGEIKIQVAKQKENVRKKQLQRSKLSTFQQFLKWIRNHYNDKVPNPLSYFYKTYVKNLRYYFYLAQQKLSQNSLIKQKKILKVPKKFLQLPSIQQKQALQYLFYQITDPKILNKNSKHLQKQQAKMAQKQNNGSLNINNSSIKTQKQTEPKKIDFNFQEIEQRIQSKIEVQSSKCNQSSLEKQQLSNLIERQAQMIQDSLYKNQEIKQKVKQSYNHNDHQDVYSDVNLQKGSVDSQVTQKSFDSENAKYYGQNQNCQFSDISQIQCKNQANKHIAKLSEIFELPKIEYQEKNMLIVMCHGFQGSSYDMTILLRGLRQLMPHASYLTARSNQGKTEGDIEQMGQRLAAEVQNYISNYMDDQHLILNFIGHSMGGIIARSSLKYLTKKYYNKLGFFCSLSSPHLGYLNGVDGMIKAGLWAILKFKPIKSLQQLKMDDSKDFRKSYLYKLSKQGNLKRFRKIILFSSFEDSYVSWHSARISAHRKKNQITKIEEQMVNNILGNSQIHRVDVNFNVQTKNLDSFIGRTAHINLIVQQSLFKIVKEAIPQLFDISALCKNDTK